MSGRRVCRGPKPNPVLRFYVLRERVPQPVTVLEWSLWLELHPSDCQVGLDQVGETKVSTVFLGLDHNLQSAEPSTPHLFETMVFGGPLHHARRRSPTWSTAERHHREVLLEVQVAQQRCRRCGQTRANVGEAMLEEGYCEGTLPHSRGRTSHEFDGSGS